MTRSGLAFLAALAVGGSARDDVAGLALLRPLAIGCAAVGALTLRTSDIRDHRGLLAGAAAILLFILVGAGVGVAPMALGRILGPHRPDPEKLAPYECGFPAFEDARMRFDVRYYLVAILFILFDLEIAFLFPWAVSLGAIGIAGWAAMMIFLAELTLGYIYAWKVGALEWE